MSHNIAIIKRPQGATGGRYEELPSTDVRWYAISAFWNKAVDIHCSRGGQVAARLHLSSSLQRLANPQSRLAAELLRHWIREITRCSPLLVNDEQIVGRDLVAYHPRAPWEGRYADFNIRSLTVMFSPYWTNAAVAARVTYVRSPVRKNLGPMCLCFLNGTLAMFHESGHLLQTFAGHGTADTPQHMTTGLLSRETAYAPEGGEMLEIYALEGLVHWAFDTGEFGDSVTGYPWIINTADTANMTARNDSAPVCAFQSRIVLSSDPDATVEPSGENATAVTMSVCPSSLCNSAPVCAFQSRTVLSQDPDATVEPSGENATAVRLDIKGS